MNAFAQTGLTLTLAAALALAAGTMIACEKEHATGTGGHKHGTDDHDHDHADHADKDGHTHGDADHPDHGDDHDHDADHDHAGHGPTTELGAQSAGGFTIKASRAGDFTPGVDAPIFVAVTGDTKSLAAVRCWVGVESGRGSVKARAELSGEQWHADAEVPKPLPAGSKLWVEIETDTGTKHAVSF